MITPNYFFKLVQFSTVHWLQNQFGKSKSHTCAPTGIGGNLFVLFLLLTSAVTYAQEQAVEFTNPGTSSWNIPAGVTEVVVEAWGAGGSAGSGRDNNNRGGGGGAGGQYARSTVNVSGIGSLSVKVAATTSGPSGNNQEGTNGDFSSVSSGATIFARAMGGARGRRADLNPATGGAGSTVDGIGDLVVLGGNGANGTSSASGGGGAAGGVDANGNAAMGGNASGTTGGTATGISSGNGANGFSSNNNGAPGLVYGGGGSGGRRRNIGGNGAQGFVRITYISAPCTDNEISVNLMFDNFPGETSWEIRTYAGVLVASGGSYVGASSMAAIPVCLPDGCYNFTIFDAFNDGICCAYGNGAYNLTDSNNNQLASGGTFGTSETSSFCLPFAQNVCDDYAFAFQLTLDDYPAETTWEVRNEDYTLVASGGPYAIMGATIDVALCLPVGCYQLLLIDSFGDGICCEYGNGSYSLTDADNNVLVTGGDFAFFDAFAFCIPDPNDIYSACADAVPIVVQTPASCAQSPVSGDFNAGNFNYLMPSCDMGVNGFLDQWFAFNSGNNSELLLTVNLGTADFWCAELFTNCQGNSQIGACFGGFSGDTPLSGLTPNTDYLIRFTSSLQFDTPGTYSFCLQMTSVPGCTDVNAGNYNPDATLDDGSCSYVLYSVASGNFTEAIWNTDPNAVSGQLAGPSALLSYHVRNGQTVNISTNVTCNNLVVEDAGGAATLQFSNDASATLYGNFAQATGSVNMTNGTLVFNGAGQQNIAAIGLLNNVTCNNAAGLVQGNDIDLRGVLKIEQGDYSTNGYLLELKSTANYTASIGAIANGSTFIGNARLERYIPPGIQNWVNLCNAIPGNTLQAWNESLVTTGFVGSDFPAYNFVNILQYDETVAGGLNDGFTQPTNITNTLDHTRGYFVYMTAPAQQVAVTGAIQQGSRTVPLNHTSTSLLQNDGWELMANIYPSEVDFEELHAASSGISATYYVYNAETASYQTYTAGLGLGTASGYIPSGQSFWVQTTQANAELVWDETHKSNVGTAFERDANPDVRYVSVGVARNNHSQKAYLVFEEGMEFAYDAGADAIHFGSLSNIAPEIAWKAESGQKLTLSRIPTNYANTETYLHLKIKQAGTYNITVDDVQNMPEFTCMYFEDLETGDVYSLEAGENIELTFEEPFEGDRFVLHVKSPIEVSTMAPMCFNTDDAIIQVEGSDDTFAYQVVNNDGGNVVSAGQLNGNQTVNGLAAGSYTITASPDNLMCTAMVIHVDIVAPEEPMVNVLSSTPFCNDAASGEIEVLASGAGNFSVELFDELGNTVSNLYMAEGSTSFPNLTAGGYQVLVNNLCISETVDVDLVDENAVISNALFNNQITIENNVAIIEAEAQCVNADSWIWFVNGLQISQGGNLAYPITEPGNYVVELYAFTESCGHSFIFDVNASMVTYIDSQNADEFKIAMTGDRVIIWSPVSTEGLTLQIYDASGRLIMNRIEPNSNGEPVELSLREFAVGTYILKAFNDEVSKSWSIQAHS